MTPGIANEHEIPAINQYGNEAHEFQAHHIQSTQSLVHFNPFEILPGNFGTIDNPALIFSNGLPYKYVGCVGHFDDHYNYHSVAWFKLKEGSCARCFICGQVYKLVNVSLGDIVKFEKQNNILNRYDINTVKTDAGMHWNLANLDNKALLPNDQNKLVPTVLTDEETHRFRNDQEFRLEVLKEREERRKLFDSNIGQYDAELNKILGLDVQLKRDLHLNNDEQLSEVENETELLKLERSLHRINKFSRRDLEGDTTQHERREKRMQQRAVLRKVNNVTHKFYSEAELQYFDYFETDEEFNNDEVDDLKIKEIVQQTIDAEQPILKDRVAPYLRLIEYFDRRMFLASNNKEREERMVQGSEARRKDLESKLLLGDSDKVKGEEFLKMLKDQQHDDEVVGHLIEKVSPEDQRLLAHKFKLRSPSSNVQRELFESGGQQDNWNIQDEEDNLLFQQDDDLSQFENQRDWFKAKFLNLQTRERLDLEDTSYITRTKGDLNTMFNKKVDFAVFDRIVLEEDKNRKLE